MKTFLIFLYVFLVGLNGFLAGRYFQQGRVDVFVVYLITAAIFFAAAACYIKIRARTN